MSEKIRKENKKTKGRRDFPGAYLPVQPIPVRPGRPSWPAQPTWASSSVIFLPDRRTGACPTRAPPRRATSFLPAYLSSPSSLWMTRASP